MIKADASIHTIVRGRRTHRHGTDAEARATRDATTRTSERVRHSPPRRSKTKMRYRQMSARSATHARAGRSALNHRAPRHTRGPRGARPPPHPCARPARRGARPRGRPPGASPRDPPRGRTRRERATCPRRPRARAASAPPRVQRRGPSRVQTCAQAHSGPQPAIGCPSHATQPQPDAPPRRGAHAQLGCPPRSHQTRRRRPEGRSGGTPARAQAPCAQHEHLQRAHGGAPDRVDARGQRSPCRPAARDGPLPRSARRDHARVVMRSAELQDVAS